MLQDIIIRGKMTWDCQLADKTMTMFVCTQETRLLKQTGIFFLSWKQGECLTSVYSGQPALSVAFSEVNLCKRACKPLETFFLLSN